MSRAALPCVLAAILAANGVQAGGPAPWGHVEDPVIRLAAQPGLCVTAAGEALELRACGAASERQRLVGALPHLEERMRLAAGCAGNGTQQFGACGNGILGGTEFKLPATGHGSIRLVGAEGGEACLGPVGDSVGEGTVVAMVPCAEDAEMSQAFLLPRARATDGNQPFLGVNLGGWLILEAWMWPSEMMFKHIEDEHTFVAKHGGPGNEQAQKAMREHWDTFLQPQHLDSLRRFGFTHVRIPFGYWLLDGVYNEADGFVAGGEPFLARALGWLKARGMRAVLDLHAMPGGQAVNQSFTGRISPTENFFLKPSEFARGKRAVKELVKLVQKYEEDETTSGVVVGVELLNEPTDKHYDQTTEFYAEMVPVVRKALPAEKYIIMLSFMDSPHTKSVDWLAARITEDPETWSGVVHDPHLYHLFGDNYEPWSEEQDFCKVCCRDAHILRPSAALVPTIVGEYALATGYWGWQESRFLEKNFHNYMSLWSKMESIVGSFLWSFRILPDYQDTMLSLEWSLLDLVDQGFLSPHMGYSADVSSLCPAMGELAQQCPDFSNTTVHFATGCEWQRPAAKLAPALRGGGRRLLDGRAPAPHAVGHLVSSAQLDAPAASFV